MATCLQRVATLQRWQPLEPTAVTSACTAELVADADAKDAATSLQRTVGMATTALVRASTLGAGLTPAGTQRSAQP